MSNKRSILVTDGLWRKSLAVVRALSNAGVNVGLGERTWMAPALFSRHVNNRYIYPSLEKNQEAFLDWITAIAKTNKYDAIITPEEETSLFIAQHFSEISPYIRIPLASYKTLSFVRNKFKLLAHAHKIGIPCPKTILCNTFDDACKEIKSVSLPVVLKPVISSGGHGIRYIFDIDTFNRQSQIISTEYDSFLMQEYIPGTEYYGVSVIYNDHNQMRSAFVHKKLRQFPITGGVSTCAVSVKYPELIEIAEKVLTSISWYGSANVEFKIDQRDNTPKLMEINPRLWGSLQLTVASGINVPYLLYQLAMKGDIAPHFKYQVGVKFRWFMYGDFVNSLLILIKQKKFNFDNYRLFEKNSHHATWSLSDPMPYFVGLPLFLIDYLTSDEMEKFR
jgi:predicted ATP-grasp superfamily ATP-dependent carboligase